jgi:hypothetical protein
LNWGNWRFAACRARSYIKISEHLTRQIRTVYCKIDEGTTKHKRGNMKLSIEAKVAAAVAAGFLTLTAGAMAQGRHKGQAGGRNDFGSTNNSGVQMHMSQQESSKSSLFDSTNAEENRQKFSDENVTRQRERERSRTNGNVTEREREREREKPNGVVEEQRQEQRTNAAGQTQTRSQERTMQPNHPQTSDQRKRERSRTNGSMSERERERERELPNGVVEEQRQEQRTNAAGQTQTRSQERTKQPNP